MAATAAHGGYRDASASGMSKPVVVSLVFHGIVLLLAIVGLPYISKAPPQIDQPIPIEMVNAPVAEIAHVTKPASSPAKINIPKPIDTKEPPKPVPPTKTTEEPPKPVAPKPPEPVKNEAHPEQVEDALAPPDKLLKKLKTPPKKPTPPAEKKPEKAKDPTEDMNALLKNLIKSDPTASVNNAPVKEDAPPTPQATLGDQMTMSEMDAVRQQLGECWKLLAGARYAEDLVVEIKMTMTPDKHIASAVIVDQLRYSGDTFFRAAADSALRAVYDPHCNPLQQLPDGKYGMWKELDIDFDPREMLR